MACKEYPYYSTCENPEPPSWVWRYNRDKHLSRFEPWMTRVDQWHPRYRHMGVPYNFDFEMDQSPTAPVRQAKLTYARDLVCNRETGFGNAGLGNPPGPAPPVLRTYNKDHDRRGELYRQCGQAGISGGVSSWDWAPIHPEEHKQDLRDQPPLNPRQYLKETLGQAMEFPGTYPACVPRPDPMTSCTRSCPARSDGPRDPLALWRGRHNDNLRAAAQERAQTARSDCSRPYGSPDGGIFRADVPFKPLPCNNSNNNHQNDDDNNVANSGTTRPVGFINNENNVFGNNCRRCISDSLSDHYEPSMFVRPATSMLVAHHQIAGARSDNYPLANF